MSKTKPPTHVLWKGQTWNIAEDLIQTREAKDMDIRLVPQGRGWSQL